MLRRYALLIALALCGAPAPAAEPAGLKVAYITGGGYHDYPKLTPAITAGIARHANVRFDVKQALEAIRDPKLGEGYDAIVYNFCFADEQDPQLIENALRVTRAGKPTVLVHCSMHCFMASDGWTECCGQRTRRHDAYRAFGTVKADPAHPVLKNFPDHWQTPGDELYQTIQFPKQSHALLKAKSAQSGQEHVVCWTHEYGKGRVFATTLGHDLKTVGQDDYHRLLAAGLLWACDRLADDGQPKPGFAGEK